MRQNIILAGCFINSVGFTKFIFLQPFSSKNCSLGLYSHAVKHYESVLKLAEQNGVSLIPPFFSFDFIIGFPRMIILHGKQHTIWPLSLSLQALRHQLMLYIADGFPYETAIACWSDAKCPGLTLHVARDLNSLRTSRQLDSLLSSLTSPRSLQCRKISAENNSPNHRSVSHRMASNNLHLSIHEAHAFIEIEIRKLQPPENTLQLSSKRHQTSIK